MAGAGFTDATGVLGAAPAEYQPRRGVRAWRMPRPWPSTSAVLTSARCVNACGKLPSRRRCDRVVLLRQQADVVAQVEQALEQLARLGVPALQRQRVGQPERARQEHALAGLDAVHRRRRCAAGSAGRARRRSARAASPRPSRRTAGRSAAGIPTDGISSTLASSSSESYDCVNACFSSLQPRASTSAWISSRSSRQRSTGPASAELLVHPHGAVEGHPRHHLGVGEVPRRAAHLPDAGVLLAPALLEPRAAARGSATTPSRRRSTPRTSVW